MGSKRDELEGAAIISHHNGSSLERCTARSPWGGGGHFMGNYDIPFGP